jgi:fructose-bisphosphate aldolase class 1
MTSPVMNEEQLQKMKSHPGLDQSGGSTPHALALYGLKDHSWADDDESFPGYPSRARSRGQNRGARRHPLIPLANADRMPADGR